jgi:hypothetical protein
MLNFLFNVKMTLRIFSDNVIKISEVSSENNSLINNQTVINDRFTVNYILTNRNVKDVIEKGNKAGYSISTVLFSDVSNGSSIIREFNENHKLYWFFECSKYYFSPHYHVHLVKLSESSSPLVPFVIPKEKVYLEVKMEKKVKIGVSTSLLNNLTPVENPSPSNNRNNINNNIYKQNNNVVYQQQIFIRKNTQEYLSSIKESNFECEFDIDKVSLFPLQI